jgi:hypothetical protein
MATDEILGIDIHDAIMGLKRAVENDRLRINSPLTIRALEKVSFGPDGRIDPTLSGRRFAHPHALTSALTPMIGPHDKRPLRGHDRSQDEDVRGAIQRGDGGNLA